jgi:hypothetical protein
MNKIERAISETRQIISMKQREKTYLISQINALEDMLEILKKIELDKSIPNEETKVSETFLNSNKTK